MSVLMMPEQDEVLKPHKLGSGNFVLEYLETGYVISMEVSRPKTSALFGLTRFIYDKLCC